MQQVLQVAEGLLVAAIKMCCSIRLHVSGHTLLSCQPRVTVTICFVYRVTRDLESIYYLFINPICRIGLIHK